MGSPKHATLNSVPLALLSGSHINEGCNQRNKFMSSLYKVFLASHNPTGREGSVLLEYWCK